MRRLKIQKFGRCNRRTINLHDDGGDDDDDDDLISADSMSARRDATSAWSPV